DWEIHGAMSLTEPCVATSLASVLAGKGSGSDYRGASPEKFSRQLSAMRTFRDRYFHRHDGLQGWWNVAAPHSPQLAYLTMRDSAMRKSAGVIFKGIEGVLGNLDAALPKDFLDHAQRAVSLARKSGFRRLRIDASQAEAILKQLKPRSTGQDALKLFAK